MKTIAALLLTLGLATTLHGAELSPEHSLIDTPLLSLPDLGGDPLGLEASRGKVVLINFWASWCAPCLIEMPSMQRLYDSLRDRPFALLAVNVGEPRAKAWRFANIMQVDFPVLLDSDSAAAAAWNVQVYPTSYLLDRNGQVRYAAYGAVKWDSETTREVIEELLEEAPEGPK